MMLSLDLPIRTVNELNDHSFWRARQRRAKAQRNAVTLALNPKPKPALPCRIHLTRIAPSNGLDKHDGLPASMKFVADAIAEWLGVDDSDPRLEFFYAQRRGAAGEYGVNIVIVSKEMAA